MNARAPIVLSTISVSPHLTAVFEEFAKLCPFKYLYHTEKHDPQRARCGWSNVSSLNTEFVGTGKSEALENAPLLLEAMRDLDLIERRLRRGLPTVYMSERWLKPFGVTVLGKRFYLPGIVRLIFPRYFRMVRRFVRCLRAPKCYYLPQGIWAARDMAQLCGIFSGDVKCLFRAPDLKYERFPCGQICSGNDTRFCTDKMRLWGYFVAPSEESQKVRERDGCRVLWVGRMLDWKRVDTLITAAHSLPNMKFTIVGEGPEENRLRSFAHGMDNITFMKYQSTDRIRSLMREHDFYVLTSDGGEGWGAALNEALEEGMSVLGTYEAGASATMLDESRLFSAGDAHGLVQLLEKSNRSNFVNHWSGRMAAQKLHEFIKETFP